jgi:hypothetical protein
MNMGSYVMLLYIDRVDIVTTRGEFLAALGAGVLSAGCLSEKEASGPNANSTGDSDLEMCATGENTLKGFSVGEPIDDIKPLS